MTPAEVAQLDDKVDLVAKHTTPPFKPHRLKNKWVNEKGTIARLMFVGSNQWVDAEPWQLPPAGRVWTNRGWQVQ